MQMFSLAVYLRLTAGLGNCIEAVRECDEFPVVTSAAPTLEELP